MEKMESLNHTNWDCKNYVGFIPMTVCSGHRVGVSCHVGSLLSFKIELVKTTLPLA